HQTRKADFLIGIVQMLVADESKESVLDQRATDFTAQQFAMQLRNLLVGRDVGILLVEERGSVQPIGSAMPVGFAVNGVGARSRAHVDVSAAGGALLRVVHRSVHAHLLNRLRSRSGQRLADGEVDGSGALNRSGARTGDSSHTGVVDDAGRGDLACALAVKQIAGVDSVQQETVAGIALAIGPDRLVAESAVGAGAAR